ncbi:MAG: hypothetical protein LBP54_08195 [Campylobacteraceae bacterium]|jgi:hypothetical protein|nr:hypothetical protein [Campylobacteraceae bacterium]
MNNEVLYKIDERNPAKLILSDIFIIVFLPFLSYAAIYSKAYIYVFAGVLLSLVDIWYILNVFTFKEIIIYKDRIVFDRYVFGKSTVNINNIKRIDTFGCIWNVGIVIQTKDSYFSRFKYCATSLYEKQINEMCKIIQNLQEKKQ